MLEIEQPAKAADFGVRARPRGRPHQRLDQVHHPVAGIDIDAGLRVSEAALVFCHDGARRRTVRDARNSGKIVRSRMLRRGPTWKTQVAQWSRRRYTPPKSTARFGHLTPALSSTAGIALSIPNLITLARILLVPIVVWAIATPGTMWIAFLLFLAAGVSDAIDGFLAKRFAMTTELGAYLDPLADKALIVSIYLTLGINNLIPALAGHPGGVARHPHRRRRHAGLGDRATRSRSSRCWSPSSTRWRRLYSPAWCWARSASAIRSQH